MYTLLVVNFRTYARKTNRVFSLSFPMIHLSSPFPLRASPVDLSPLVHSVFGSHVLVWSRDEEYIGRKPLWSLAAQKFKLFRFSKFSLASQTSGGKVTQKIGHSQYFLSYLYLFLSLTIPFIPLYSVQITSNIDHWI